jgi:cytochrome c oxidase subunit 1
MSSTDYPLDHQGAHQAVRPYVHSDKLSFSDALYVLVTTVDHKKLGLMYVVASLIFLVIAGLMASVMRLQLAFPNGHVVSPATFNRLFTMHGTTMVFLVGMPLLAGFANYLIPLMIGARDMAFPRLNAFGFWIFLFGGFLLYFSYVGGGGLQGVGSAPDVGWFAYSPLTERAFSRGLSTDYWTLGVLCSGIGSIASAINVIVTIASMRCPGMTLSRMPMFVWLMLVDSWLILIALPPLSAAQIMLAAAVAIGFISLSVWAHHMFAVGLDSASNIFFAAATMMVGVPTGIKIFNWLATMYGGKLIFCTPMLFCVAFLFQFLIAGLTGIMLGVTPFDWQLHDSYFVVAHFHFTLVGGFVFGIFAGIYYWFPKASGRMLSETLGKWHFWLLTIGFNVTFIPLHFVGMMGMPRRIYTYPYGRGWELWNLVASVGVVFQLVAVALFVWNVLQSLGRTESERAGDDPWNAWTLEWATHSPPPEYNFEKIPVVYSSRPLWDLKHPDDPDWKFE